MKKILAVLLFIGIVFGVGVQIRGEDEDGDDGYEALFTHGNLHEIEIVITQEEWDGLIQDMIDYAEEFDGSLQTGNYRKATFIYRGPAGDTVIDEVGFRTKGRFRVIPEDDEGVLHRAHFKLKFNKAFDLEEGTPEYDERNDRRFCRLRKLILRAPMHSAGSWDRSQMQELYCYDLMRRAGVYTSRAGSTRLTITIGGTQHYFGIYTLIEPIDKSFLTKRYGRSNNDGNLYKCPAGDGGPSSLNSLDSYPALLRNDPSFLASLVGVKDEETGYFPTYDLKTNEDEADHTVLWDFIENLNSLSGDELKEYLDEHFEVDRFLRYQAMNVLLGKWDDYWTMGNNYYLYFNNDGKIEFIPYDYDNALGDSFFYTPSTGIYDWGYHFNEFAALMFEQPLSLFNWLFTPASPLVEKIFQIDQYRETYEGYAQEFITPSNNLFIYSDYENKYNQLHELYALYLDNDIDEGETMSNEERRGRYFFERTKSVIAELDLNEEDYDTGPASLGIPTGVAATDETYKAMIIVTWEPVAFADYYQVYRANTSEDLYGQISETITGTSFTDESVAADSTYYYKVKAFTNDGLASDFSLEASGSTNDGSVIAPTGVSATDGTYSHMITISWNAALNAHYYRVYRSEFADGVYEKISEDISATIFNDKSIVGEAIYYYKVKAFANDGAESEFSSEDAGSTSDAGLSAPVITRGAALESGAYVPRDDTEVNMYIFYDDGACKVSRPIQAFTERTVFEGEWRYNDDGKALMIDTTASCGAARIHFTEVWENAFTLYNGSVLNVLGFKKVTGDEDGIGGRYEGRGAIEVEVGTGMADIIVAIEGAFTMNDDGTWTFELSVITDGDVTTAVSEAGSGFANRLIEFGGSYYLPIFGSPYIRIPRLISAILYGKDYGDLLQTTSDPELRNSEEPALPVRYYAGVQQILLIRSQYQMFESQLRSLVMEKGDIVEEFED